MKKIIMSAMMAVIALSASAQNQEKGTFSVTPKVGTGATVFTNNINNVEGVATASIGADVQYQATKVLGISAGLNAVFGKSDTKHICGTNKDISYEIGQVNMPVLLHANVGSHFGFFAGIQPGCLVMMDQTIKNGGKGRCFEKTHVEDLNRFQCSIPVGVSFVCAKKVPITLTLSGNIPLTKISNKINSKMVPVEFTIGYRF